MKPLFKLVLLLIVGLSGSCAPVSETPGKPHTGAVQALTEDIAARLPGAYSNYAQVYEDGTDGPVTDINIRQLNTGEEPVFLFESQQRDSDTSSHEIYWLKWNRQSQRAEFHFAHLREDELSLPIPEVLELAWRRVNPACAIVMTHSVDRSTGHTNPDTCLFEHLLQGETRLYRELSVDSDMLNIENTLTVSSGQVSADSTSMNLQKHRVFGGWASTRAETDPNQNEPDQWRLSTIFKIRDDGRVNKLYDDKMNPLDFGLKLAKLPWIEGQPPYMLLAVISMETDEIQAYTWFESATELLELNLDWFQTSLELIKPEKT